MRTLSAGIVTSIFTLFTLEMYYGYVAKAVFVLWLRNDILFHFILMGLQFSPPPDLECPTHLSMETIALVRFFFTKQIALSNIHVACIEDGRSI